MRVNIKHIASKIQLVVTLLILAGQILTSIKLMYSNSISQNQNTITSSLFFSSDQLLTESFTRDNPSRLKILLPISDDKFVRIVGYNSKSAALLDYYMTYSCTVQQQYSLHISQNHSLRSPPAYI